MRPLHGCHPGVSGGRAGSRSGVDRVPGAAGPGRPAAGLHAAARPAGANGSRAREEPPGGCRRPLRGRGPGVLRASPCGVSRAGAAGAEAHSRDRRVRPARGGGAADHRGARAAAAGFPGHRCRRGRIQGGLHVMTPVWLGAQTARLRGAYAAGRLPHALLIHEAPGAGGEWLAGWVARMVLCSNPGQAPCDRCPACHRASQGQHPDLINVRPLETSTQIRIEQVRELSAELALTAHQGGYKVGILSPADSMNRFAANALLKTLEEPPQRTLLVLVASQPSRLPATILSRCQRVRVRAPERAEAVAWLEAARGPADWGKVLAVLGTAPMAAADADPAAVAEVAAEVRRSLEEAVAGAGDPVATAERWARSELPLRLRCVENWLTERIRGRAGVGALFTEVRAGTHSRGHGESLDLRQLFGLLDAVRELKSSFDAPINRGLALQSLRKRTCEQVGTSRAS